MAINPKIILKALPRFSCAYTPNGKVNPLEPFRTVFSYVVARRHSRLTVKTAEWSSRSSQRVRFSRLASARNNIEGFLPFSVGTFSPSITGHHRTMVRGSYEAGHHVGPSVFEVVTHEAAWI